MKAGSRSYHFLPAAILLLTGTAGAEQRRVYVPEMRRERPELVQKLQDLDRAVAANEIEEAAAIMDELLREAAEPATGNLLVRAPGTRRLSGLRSSLLARIAALPPAHLTALRDLQEEKAQRALRSQHPPGPSELVARFPISRTGGEVLLRQLSEALEAADLALCQLLGRLLTRVHPNLAAGKRARSLAAFVERLLERPPPKETPAAPAGARLVPVGVYPLAPSSRRTSSPSYPRELAGRVCVSNGATLRVFSRKGEPLGSIPQDPRASAKPPPEVTGFRASIAGVSSVGFTPMVLERWLAPGRGVFRESDASFAGRYYCLVAFDPVRARVLWWDGDPGPFKNRLDRPGRPPPGLEMTRPKLLRTLVRGHVIACAEDGRRVYLAITGKGDEPELRIMAYEAVAGPGQRLTLRPAWNEPTYLFSAERPGQGTSEDESVVPEIAACLALDGAGHLVCTTDAGVTACLETGTGSLRWIYEPEWAPAKPERFRPFRPRPAPRIGKVAPAPPRFVRHPSLGLLAVFSSGLKLRGARLDDGVPVWNLDRGAATRIALVPQQDPLLVVYGAKEVRLVDALTGRPFHRVGILSIAGELAIAGRTLFLPVRRGVPAHLPGFLIQPLEIRSGRTRSLLGSLPIPIPSIREPVNLLATDEGLVAASSAQVVFYRWETGEPR